MSYKNYRTISFDSEDNFYGELHATKINKMNA